MLSKRDSNDNNEKQFPAWSKHDTAQCRNSSARHLTMLSILKTVNEGNVSQITRYFINLCWHFLVALLTCLPLFEPDTTIKSVHICGQSVDIKPPAHDILSLPNKLGLQGFIFASSVLSVFNFSNFPHYDILLFNFWKKKEMVFNFCSF